MRQLLAYQTLIVREVCRCSGRGWLAYDSYFRQQVVGDDAADWSKLNQSLYAVTFIAQGDRERGRSCVICLESDHAEEQCALYSSATRSAVGRKERSSSERGLEMKESASRRVRWPASPGISQSADILPANTGTCVYGAEATTRSTSVRGGGRRMANRHGKLKVRGHMKGAEPPLLCSLSYRTGEQWLSSVVFSWQLVYAIAITLITYVSWLRLRGVVSFPPQVNMACADARWRAITP